MNNDILYYIKYYLNKEKKRIRKQLVINGGVKPDIQIFEKMSNTLPETKNIFNEYVQNYLKYNGIINNIIYKINTEINIEDTNIIKEIKDKIEDVKKKTDKFIKNETQYDFNNNQKMSKNEKHKLYNMLPIFSIYINEYKKIIDELQNATDDDIILKLVTEFKDLKTKMNGFNDKIIQSLNELDRQIQIYEDNYDYNKNKSEIYIVQDNSTVYDYFIRLNIDKTQIEKIKNMTEDAKSIENFVKEMIENTFKQLKGPGKTLIKQELIDTINNLPSIFKKENKIYLIQEGGSLNNIQNINNLQQEIINFIPIVENFCNNIQKYKSYIEIYNQYIIRYNNYLLYILTILTSDKYNKNVLVFGYINKGLLQMYYYIIKNILTKIRLNDINDNLHRYFDRYHYFTLIYLEKFIKYVLTEYIKEITPENKTTFIININKTLGRSKLMLIILSHFKDILDSYNELFQKNVTIYARINDWGTIKEKMFLPYDKDENKEEIDMTDLINMKVKTNVCPKFKRNVLEDDKLKIEKLKNPIQFTGVYDTVRYPDNETISSYMLMATQLSKGKGVFLMTYGYSGTGKTFTLFGNKNKQGILQSTLNGIRGLKKIGFRSYEIYGLGVAYPHYWNNLKKNVPEESQKESKKLKESKESKESKEEQNIYQKIYEHIIEIKNEILFKESKEYDVNDPNEYLNTAEYHFVEETNVTNVFRSFDNYIKQLDAHRRTNNRIRTTPNNPESSRSIVVYDFIILIEEINDDRSIEKYVNFTIIDLPGREEITQTYVETYLNKKYNDEYIIPEEYRNPFYKALLGSIVANPLGIALLVPTIILKTINDFAVTDETIKDIYDNNFFSQQINIGIVTSGAYTINTIYDTSNKEQNGIFKIIDNNYYEKTLPGQSRIVSITNVKPHPKQTKKNSIQYQTTIAIYVIDRLIINKRFDILTKIYENIINKYMPLDSIYKKYVSDDEKINFLSAFLEKEQVDEIKITKQIDKKFRELVEFKYFYAQHEGIYINQNIMGLLKHLIKTVLNLDDTQIIEKQPTDLNFEIQKNNFRNFNFNLYYENFNLYNEKKDEPYENIYRNTKYLEYLYENAKGKTINIEEKSLNNLNDKVYFNIPGYSSQKIFDIDVKGEYTKENYPFMGKIIDFYMQDRNIDKIPVKPITDVKVFYLFSNTSMELKCANQVDLLINTLSLIDAIKN
jgi:hypothetical protein